MDERRRRIQHLLRLEVRRDRVQRVQRGWYRSLSRPETTRRRHRDRLIDLQHLASRAQDPGGSVPW